MKFSIASILAVVSLTAVNAQLGGISTCVLGCTQGAATEAGCTGLTDLGCICTSADFQNAATACLTANCTQEEQQTAVQLQQQLCAGQSASGSLSTTISAPSASSSIIDGGALSSLSDSVAMTGSASGASASVSGASASATSAVSGASASVSGASNSASSVLSAGGSAISGASGSVSSIISGATSSPSSANKVEVGIKWGVVGASAMGLVMGAWVVL